MLPHQMICAPEWVSFSVWASRHGTWDNETTFDRLDRHGWSNIHSNSPLYGSGYCPPQRGWYTGRLMNSPGKHAWQISAADEQHTGNKLPCRRHQFRTKTASVGCLVNILNSCKTGGNFSHKHGPPYELPRFCGLTTILPKQPVPPQYLVILLRVVSLLKHRFRLAAQYLPTASVNIFWIRK
jgi:hypothetical protein